MLDRLKELDTNLFLLINSKHSAFFDFIMYWASNRWIWIPFYILLVCILYKDFGKKVILIVLLAATVVALSDQLASGVIKNLVERPRPTHVAELASRIHIVKEYTGGSFGFVSSHAANTFALALFLIFISRHRLKGMHIALIAYASLVSYSRIYLGVHYPGDVLGGMLLGLLLAFIFAFIYKRLENKFA